MQTTSLPLQLNINATGPAQRNSAASAINAAGDAGQFSAMLSSEMAQAQAPAPAPAPAAQAPAAPKQDAAKPAPADHAAQADAPASQAAGTGPDQANAAAKAGNKDSDASAKADGKDEGDDKAAQGASQQAAGDPASAMLALMASLQQTATKPGAAGTAKSFDALDGNAAKGKRADGAQLAALQAAMKSVGKDGLDAKSATGAAKTPALAADGAQIGAGDKAAADLSAALSGAGVKAELKPQFDAAELSLQKAREAAQLAARQDPAQLSALNAAQVQPAALEAAQAAAGASEELSAQVGTDAWENQVGQKVVYMLGNEEQTASLTLNPPDLGPMQVVLSVSNDQASVTFSANQQEVRQALENALPRLREMMSESGIALGNATVNAGMPDGRQAQDQSARGNNNGGGNRGRVDGVDAGADAPRTVTRSALLGDRGMVDTFA